MDETGFHLFQHGCNDSFFKGCEKSFSPIFDEDGNVEKYIKSFACLFGIYIDIRKEGFIKNAWVHILLSILIGFDIYSQNLEKKYTFENEILRNHILTISNENNTLYKYRDLRDLNIGIKIGLKLAGTSFENVVEKMKKNEGMKNEEKKGEKEQGEEKKEKGQTWRRTETHPGKP